MTVMSYAQAIATTDAIEAQMRDDEDRKTPEGRERIRLRVEAAKQEMAKRDPKLK